MSPDLKMLQQDLFFTETLNQESCHPAGQTIYDIED